MKNNNLKNEIAMIGEDMLMFKVCENKIVDYMIKLLLAGWVWFLPIWPALLALFGFCGIDFITGVMRSKKLGITFSSTRIRLSVNKLVAYFFLILTTHILQKVFANPLGLNVYKFLVFFFSTIEVISIYENLSVVLGVDLVKAFKSSISRANINKTDFEKIKNNLNTKDLMSGDEESVDEEEPKKKKVIKKKKAC